MKNCGLTLILFCLFISPIAPELQAEQEDFDWQRLLNGEILVEKIDDEQGIPGLRALFTIRATREELWGMLTDYDEFKNIYKGIDSLRVISEGENGALVEFFQATLFKRIHYVLQRNYVKAGYNLTWESVSGDMEYIRGSWEILDSPDDDLRLVIYTSSFRYGGIIPTRITRHWAMRQVRDMAENARTWIRDNRMKQT